MQTKLPNNFRATAEGQAADAILRKCVHCGFCTATCPTYQLLGNELDSPRGRIYLMKSMLEGEEVSATTQLHLDRCLTCRACETTCPSGVEYGRLLDIGREHVERYVPRRFGDRLMRRLLCWLLTRRRIFARALAMGQRVRPLLPARLRDHVPPRRTVSSKRAQGPADKQVILLEGCVQPSLAPATNHAAAHVLARLGYGTANVTNDGCCGAVPHHLSRADQARQLARYNIDAWWPHIEAGVEAIVSTASGCGVMVKDYAHLLAADSVYRDKAARVSSLTKDLVEIVAAADWQKLRRAPWAPRKIAFQSPCTLQHGQRLEGKVEMILTGMGFVLTAVPEPHLCCGSAGTYSLMQPAVATDLRARKLERVLSGDPDLIATANVGCQMHLEAASRIPVRHWAELVQ
jgi:glycolate oxidase iron-sulfur subunit